MLVDITFFVFSYLILLGPNRLTCNCVCFVFANYDHSLKLQNRTGAQNNTSFKKRTNKTKKTWSVRQANLPEKRRDEET